MDWAYIEDTVALIQRLQADGYEVLAIEQAEQAQFLNTFQVDKKKKYALVFGNEVKGVSQKAVNQCDGVIEIPQYGTKHSLNISVSAGVVVWDFWSKFNA